MLELTSKGAAQRGASGTHRRCKGVALGAFIASIAVFGLALPASAALPPPAADSGVLAGIEIPPAADLTTFTAPDGSTTVVVTSPTGDLDLSAVSALRVGETRTVSTEASVTTYAAPAGTCTQSQSMTNPVSSVKTNAAGTRYLTGTWKMSRSSGCSGGYSWTATIWGTDPFWGYITPAREEKSNTPPGYTTTVIMQAICKGKSTRSWRYTMYSGLGELQRTDTVDRTCSR